MRTTVKRLLAPLAVLAMAACDETPVSLPELPEATTVTVTASEIQLVVGDVASLQARVLDQEGRPLEDASPTFTSDAPTVAFVDPSGLVRAVTPGTANITAAYGGATAQTRVTVTRDERGFVRSLELMADSLAVDTRMGVQAVTVRAFDGTGQQVCPALTIRSSDASVATAVLVASAGGCRLDVTPVFPGETTITVTADGVSDSVRVRVTSEAMTAFVSARPAAASIFAGNTVPYTVRVIDEAGNGIAGRVVNLDVSAGTLSASRVTTGADGTATVQWTLPTRLNEVGRNHTFRMRTQLPNGSVVTRTEDVAIDTAPLVRLTLYSRDPSTGTLSTLNPAQPISLRIYESFNLAAEGVDQFGNQAAPSLVFSIPGSLTLCGSQSFISETLRGVCVLSFSSGRARITVSGNGLSRSVDLVFGNG